MRTDIASTTEDIIDSQLAANILVGLIAIISVAGLIGTVGAFYSMGRSAYRKD